jgi:hypothetical protein
MWIWGKLLGFLGFKDAEKWLTGFKFDDLVKEAGTDPETGEFSFVTLITNFIESIGEWFSGLLDKAKGLLKSLNPFADKSDADKQTEIQEKIETLKEERKTAKFSKDESVLESIPGRAMNKEEIDEEIAALNKESVDLQAQTASNIGTLTDHATTKGSIFVHDISVEEKMAEMTKSSDSAAKTMEVAVGSDANATAAGTVIVSTPPAAAAAPVNGGGSSTTNVSSSSVNHVSNVALRDQVRPEQSHMRRFSAT